ncbi:hypothetical protein Glove_152g49 [Diversispora epigaea]|uniref:Uncharacterized protein n=1 Tax=Diversispora epigaea TaxID=1348612 RepID=A0A397IST5_9GLOM|nr:hypothetical protein Glove_152g49 [Diversispora epigaea]
MVEWTDAQIRILIDERRNRNDEYHRIESDFGITLQPELIKSITRALMGTNLMCEYMAGNRRARSQTGAQYFDEFRTHFWERPEDDFDRILLLEAKKRIPCIDCSKSTGSFSSKCLIHIRDYYVSQFYYRLHIKALKKCILET